MVQTRRAIGLSRARTEVQADGLNAAAGQLVVELVGVPGTSRSFETVQHNHQTIVGQCALIDEVEVEEVTIGSGAAFAVQRYRILRPAPARKDGLQVFYSLRTPCILNFLACATRAIQQNLKEQSKALASD